MDQYRQFDKSVFTSFKTQMCISLEGNKWAAWKHHRFWEEMKNCFKYVSYLEESQWQDLYNEVIFKILSFKVHSKMSHWNAMCKTGEMHVSHVWSSPVLCLLWYSDLLQIDFPDNRNLRKLSFSYCQLSFSFCLQWKYLLLTSLCINSKRSFAVQIPV